MIDPKGLNIEKLPAVHKVHGTNEVHVYLKSYNHLSPYVFQARHALIGVFVNDE